ncbi:hypothetical protein IWQ62_003849 [Dispira parvispora]|uniref:Uncharacterized protein n=1 Tax=Dispira parvispora TaxID=1520584 RepID=A0A9W8E664_9FUNG|nr:hypothetical protein IWQ62_003849 [Dispira parvispora]
MWSVLYLVPLIAITLWYLWRIWANYQHYRRVDSSDSHPMSLRDILPSLSYVPWRSSSNISGSDGDSFQRDMEAGLSSSTFDISQNIRDGDTRSGLDRGAEIAAIMKTQGCDFDEARKIYHQRTLRSNNVDPATGIPLDPKAVFFSPPLSKEGSTSRSM